MKKGFTLVELLAVIVILAIIALIVTPVVGNIITSARTSANARSVEGHIRNVELAIMQEGFTKETGDLTAYDMTDGPIPSSIIDRIPNNDSIFCMKYTIENGTVLSASDCVSNINNWNKAYSYSNSEGAKVTGTNNISLILIAPTSTDTHKGIVYMDPTDLTVECTSTSTIDASSATGCKKFYIYNDEGNIYKMIMDRNLGDNIAWASRADYLLAGGTEEEVAVRHNDLGPLTATKALNERTTNWLGNPRLITADEVAHIVGADLATTIKWDSSKGYSGLTSTTTSTNVSWYYLNGRYNADPTTYSDTNGWRLKSATSEGASQYAWLFDYTQSCKSSGCNIEVSERIGGYWTNDAIKDNSRAWLVGGLGTLSGSDAQTAVLYGIRPVIEIPKSLINS